MNKHIETSDGLSTLVKEENVSISPTTLYVDDGAILASGPTLETTAHITTLAFEETHKWLSQRGM